MGCLTANSVLIGLHAKKTGQILMAGLYLCGRVRKPIVEQPEIVEEESTEIIWRDPREDRDQPS